MTPGWAKGLATRESARRAAGRGGIACLVAASLIMLAVLVSVGRSGKPLDDAIVWTAGASVPAVIVAIAGFRMMRGNGRIVGSIVVFLLVIDLVWVIFTGLSVVILGALAIRIGLLMMVINGVRGAFALRYVDFTDALRDTFS